MKKPIVFFIVLYVLQGCNKQNIAPAFHFITVDSMEVFHSFGLMGMDVHFKVTGNKVLKDTSIYQNKSCDVTLAPDAYEYAKGLLNLVTENMTAENGKQYYSACSDCGKDMIVAWRDTTSYSWLIERPCPDYTGPLEEKISSFANVIK